MKYLLVTLEYPPQIGGIATYYQAVVNHAVDEIKVLRQTNTAVNDGPVFGRLLINRKFLFWNWLPAIYFVLALARKNKSDYLIAGQLLPMGLPVLLAAKILRKPWAIVLHGMDFGITRKSPRKKFIADCLLKSANAIVCGNHYTADLVRKTLNSKHWSKIAVVNPGVDFKIPDYDSQDILAFKREHKLNHTSLLLTVGRLVKRKGADKTMEAVKSLIDKGIEIKYAIVGAGPDEGYLKRKAQELALGESVIFTGPVNDVDKKRWFQSADIFIMPARDIDGDFEGFGIVYLLAGLYGKPVIAGRAGGVGDAVTDNRNGLLVNPESVEEIALAITKLIEFPQLRNTLGDNGREMAKNFDWNKQADKFYEALKKPL